LSHFNEVEVEGYGFKMAFLFAKNFDMAQNKKSFLLYVDLIHTIEKLNDEQAGKLFKHVLRYVNDKNPESDQFTEVVFEPIKQTLKRDLEKYEGIRQRNSENAKKRWDATACDRIPEMPTLTKNADSVSVNDNDINIIDFDSLLLLLQATFKRKFRVMNDKVKRSYKARIKEGYTIDDINNAIKNAASTKYHKENNYQYCTPEFFSRAEIIDKYSGLTIVTESDSILAHLKNN
jgi:uncharacterized phage protein (TIGR02220 family)